MWNLISGLKTLRENSVQIFLLAIWSLDVLKRIVKIFPKRLLNKEIKKAGLKFNPGLELVGLWTTGPSMLTKFSPFTSEPQNAASACASAMYVPQNALRRIAITTSKENTYRSSVRMTSFLNVLKKQHECCFCFEFVIVC